MKIPSNEYLKNDSNIKIDYDIYKQNFGRIISPFRIYKFLILKKAAEVRVSPKLSRMQAS